VRAELNQLIMSETCVEGAWLLSRIKRLDQRINDLGIGYDRAKRTWSKCIGGHRHRPQYRRYPTSDIDICFSDIGRKYVGLKTVIPISEGFRY
jgi:hypothetical protein